VVLSRTRWAFADNTLIGNRSVSKDFDKAHELIHRLAETPESENFAPSLDDEFDRLADDISRSHCYVSPAAGATGRTHLVALGWTSDSAFALGRIWRSQVFIRHVLFSSGCWLASCMSGDRPSSPIRSAVVVVYDAQSAVERELILPLAGVGNLANGEFGKQNAAMPNVPLRDLSTQVA
jgi:hypothetical protein